MKQVCIRILEFFFQTKNEGRFDTSKHLLCDILLSQTKEPRYSGLSFPHTNARRQQRVRNISAFFAVSGSKKLIFVT